MTELANLFPVFLLVLMLALTLALLPLLSDERSPREDTQRSDTISVKDRA